MATPTNPLDRYASYTYHFELHAADSIDKLEYLYSSDPNQTTSPFEPNGTLLINTRKDAHQSIDDVRYTYCTPWVDTTGTSAAFTNLTLRVTEPGGISFAEKIQKVAKKYNITSLASSLVFVLKIIFVGRYPDNTIESQIPESPFGNVLTLNLLDIQAEFDHKGGIYDLTFANNATATATIRAANQNKLARAIGYSHKNVSLTALTVREAMEKLQSKLNSNYEQTHVEDKSSKPIRYAINLDPGINGNLYIINGDTYAPGSDVKFSWHPDIPILDMIKTILGASKEVNDMIVDSSAGIRKPHHPNVRIPTYSCRYEVRESEAIAYFDILLYQGAGESRSSDFEFDYYYSEAGKNVDVIDFEIKFTTMMGWLQNTLREGVDFYTNMSGDVASDSQRKNSFVNNTLVPNKTVKSNEGVPTNIFLKPGLDTNDVKVQPSNPKQQNMGYVMHKHEAVPSAKMAFSTIGELHGAVQPQATFEIRGHLGLLFQSTPNLNGQVNMGVGMRQGGWIKVNIRDMYYRPFYYTGFYQLLTIDNIFSGGKFTQKVTAVMIADNKDTL